MLGIAWLPMHHHIVVCMIIAVWLNEVEQPCAMILGMTGISMTEQKMANAKSNSEQTSLIHISRTKQLYKINFVILLVHCSIFLLILSLKSENAMFLRLRISEITW